MKFGLLRSAAASALFFGLFTTAQAASYTFTVNWDSGELAGTSSSGWFSFDDALALPNSYYEAPDMLSDFGFTMRGSFYDLSKVATGALFFNAAGDLDLMMVGTNCTPGNCSVSGGDPTGFYVFYNPTFNQFFGTAGDSGQTFSHGQGFAEVSAVPEPGTLALMAGGLGLVGLARRKRQA